MKLMSVVVGGLLVAGCGTVKVESERIPIAQQGRYLATPGIYYALPRTEAHIAIPVTLERQTKGFKGAVYKDCLAACKKLPAASKDVPQACVLPTANDVVTLGKPEVNMRSIPDPNHLYRLNVEGGALQGINHTVNVAENGILTDSKSVVSNQGPDLVLGLITEIAKIGGTFWSAKPSLNAPKDVPTAPSLSCAEAKEIETEVNRLEATIKAIEKRRDELLIPAAGTTPKLSAAQARLADERLKANIASVQDEHAKYLAKHDMTEVTKTIKTRLTSSPLVPEENRALPASNLKFSPAVDTEKEALLSPDFQEQLTKALDFRVRISPLTPKGSPLGDGTGPPSPSNNPDAKASEESLVSGYRYRVPVAGALTLECTQKATSDAFTSICPTSNYGVIVQTELPIAQYGPIASLPREFKGKGATVSLGIHPLSAGIKNVELGVEAISAKSITDALGSVRTAVEDKKKRDAEQEQAKLNAEKSELTRERDVLSLKKEIRDLQKELAAP